VRHVALASINVRAICYRPCIWITFFANLSAIAQQSPAGQWIDAYDGNPSHPKFDTNRQESGVGRGAARVISMSCGVGWGGFGKVVL